VPETPKERRDRQLLELLNETRVALPGAQVLLAFLLTVPFATRFGRVTHAEKVALFVALMCTVTGTLLLMAPSVHHRLRWQHGEKEKVVRTASVLFLIGTALIAVGIVAAVFLVTSFLFETTLAVVVTCLFAVVVAAIWYAMPFLHTRELRAAPAHDRREPGQESG
jgi:uncharacterized membrane protein YidH (DUF202 family)